MADLDDLRVAIREASRTFYKDRAKLYRRMVSTKSSRLPDPFGSLVRYNYKAALMERLAGDLPSCVRALHVAYSGLVEAAKSDPGVRERTGDQADRLVRGIVGGLAGSGSPGEADAYLRNHHVWARTSIQGRIRNCLAVAPTFPSEGILIPGYYYLLAVQLSRQLPSLDLPALRTILTSAFDSYKSATPGDRRRHLIYISLLSADLFEHQENMEVLSQAVRSDGWDRMASLILRGCDRLTLRSLWSETSLRPDDEGLGAALEMAEGSITFNAVKETSMLPCAFRFFQEDSVELSICNWSPIVMQLHSISILFHDLEKPLEISLGSELVPGATHRAKASLDPALSAEVLRLSQVRLSCSSGLNLVYLPPAISTIDSLYSLPLTEMPAWNVAWLRGLKGYWDKSKVHLPVQKKVSLPRVSCKHVSTAATGVPIKFKFQLESGEGQIGEDDMQLGVVLLGTDHGITDSMGQSVGIDESVEITWSSPGPKMILYEVRNSSTGSHHFTQSYQLMLHDPVLLQFRRSGELLVVDIEVRIDGLHLVKWDIWDSNTGDILQPVNQPKPAASYSPGDLVRAGFLLPEGSKDPDGLLESPVFRLTWSDPGNPGRSHRLNEPVPMALLIRPKAIRMLTETSASKMILGSSTPLDVKWSLVNWTGRSHQLSLRLVFDPSPSSSADEAAEDSEVDSWVYHGPCSLEVQLKPSQTYTIRAKLVPLRIGLLPVPRFEVTPLAPTVESLPAIDVLAHPPILVLPHR